MTLEGSRRASGQSCNARPGWSPGQNGGGMARKDRHTLLVERMDTDCSSLLNEARKGVGTTMTSWQIVADRGERTCDQYFFLNPLG